MVLSRRTLYMLPTRFGLVYAAMLLVLFIVAVNYGHALGFLLTFLLTAVAMVSMLYTHKNLAGLEIIPGACAEVFAGERAAFTVWVVNSSAVARQGIRIECARVEVARVDVPAHDKVSVQVYVPSARRGYLDAPALVVASDYPLGLLRSWSRRAPSAQRCVVYPRPAPVGVPASAHDAAGAGVGASNEPNDFVGLRAYHVGDSPHHIHWKAAARGQGLLTKQFGGATGMPQWLDWDAVLGDSEARLRVLCRGVLDAHASAGHFGLRLPQTSVAPAQGEAHRARCLRALALH